MYEILLSKIFIILYKDIQYFVDFLTIYIIIRIIIHVTNTETNLILNESTKMLKPPFLLNKFYIYKKYYFNKCFNPTPTDFQMSKCSVLPQNTLWRV